jgi:hypothetical protein
VYRLQLQPNILKRPLAQTIFIRIAKAGFVVKLFFTPGLQFQASLSFPPADMPAGGIFKGRFQLE